MNNELNKQVEEPKKNKPPVRKYNLLGIHLDVWENVEEGRTYETFTLSRVFRDDKGEYDNQQINLTAAKLLALKQVIDKAVKEL